jgi:CHAT domain-containing protein
MLLLIIFILTSNLVISSPQSQQLTQAQFSEELGKAYIQNNDHLADSLIKDHRLFVKPFVNDLITECIRHELKGKTAESKQALGIAEKASATFENIFEEKNLTIGVNYLTSWTKEQKEKKLVADSLYAVGTKFRLGKEPLKAIECLQQALDLYNNIQDERGEAEVLGGLGAIYFDQDYQKSLSYYQEALKKREKVDDRQLIGNTLNSFGSVYLNYFKDFPKAIFWFNKAETIRKEIGDLAGWRTTHTYKALAYLSFGDLLTEEGKYTEALGKLDTALQLNSEIEKRSNAGEVLSHLGFVYSRLGNYSAAIEKLTESAKIMKEENDSVGLAGVYNNFGVALQGAGRIEKALDYYTNSLKIYQLHDKPDMALAIMNNMGTIYFDRKEYVKAEDYHEKGLQLSRELNEKDEEVNFLLNLANDQTMLGNAEAAGPNYESAFKISRSINSPDLIWKIFAGMAETYKIRGEYDKVVQLNDSALKIIENMRNALQSNELQASYMASERFAFEDIINMLEKFHEKESAKGYDKLAFGYAEQSKSRVLLDLLAESRAKTGNKDDYRTNSRHDLFRNTQPISLDEAELLCPDKNTIILEYMVGDSSSCLWVITKSNHKLCKIPDRKRLQEQVETIRFALLDPGQAISEFFTNTGNSLYEELIKPAEPFLSKNSKLIIIPDGVLNYLPFEVLLTDNKGGIGPGTSYANLPFLIKKYPVSYAQSASVLKSLLSEQKGIKETDSDNKKLIAFGDPVYENVNDTSRSFAGNYKRLEYSGKEIENIASYFKKGNAEVYLRNDATEENVKREGELKKFNYIHFATHGFIDEAKPDFSSLVLTKDNNSEEDGFLQATEIFNLNLNADLVVLSACQTGLGKLIRGEGMVGLTRAFMYAGTPTVLVSLWSVSDVSTATLMGEFYKNLIKEKLGKTDALRNAQLFMLSDEKFAHPFYWAPFVLIGDWR